jgi:hypothetical protein
MLNNCQAFPNLEILVGFTLLKKIQNFPNFCVKKMKKIVGKNNDG